MAAKLARILAITLSLWCVVYMLNLLDYVNVWVVSTRHLAIFLGLLMPLAFLLYPAKKGIGVKWYDWLLIVISLISNGYVVFFHGRWMTHAGVGPTTLDVVLCAGLIVALLEGLRRVVGPILSVVCLFFILHPLLCAYMPGIFHGRGYSLERVAWSFYLPPAGIYGMPLNIGATIVIAFLLFGQLLVASGGGKTLMDITLSVVGRLRGGAGKAAVFGSGLFGTLNGAVSANVATTGTFTIPMMKETGYAPDVAAGIESAASNGGMLLPPVMGAVAFIMAEWLGIPYWQLCIQAFIPAVLYYVLMFMQVDFYSGRQGLRSLPAAELPSLKNTIMSGWPYLFPVVVLVYLLFVAKFTPEYAGMAAAASILLVTAFRKKTRLSLGKIANALEESGKLVVTVGLPCAMAGLIMASVSLTGIAFLLSNEIVRTAGGNLFLILLLAAAASFALGLGMTALPVYVFVALMVAPALATVGIPLVSSHLFVFWVAMGSFITPPVCVAAFVAAGIAKAPPMRVGLRATQIGIGIFIIPFAFIYNPGLLLQGSVTEILLAVVACLIGILPLAAGLTGYLLKPANWLQRALLLSSGIMMFVPIWWVRLLAVGIIVVCLIWQKYGLPEKGLISMVGHRTKRR